MTYKHTAVDDYPYLTYNSNPNAVQATSDDVAGLDTRLDAIEAANWVTSSRIADGAVTTDKLGSKAVTGAKVADKGIDTGQIADGAIGTDQIKDGAVTAAKIAE